MNEAIIPTNFSGLLCCFFDIFSTDSTTEFSSASVNHIGAMHG